MNTQSLNTMFNKSVNTVCNNTLFKCQIIPHMNEQMERLYLAAKILKKTEGQSAVARLLNQSPQTVKNWESRGISTDGLLVAQKIIGCVADWVQTGEGEMCFVSNIEPEKNYPRVVGTARCGNNGYYLDLEGGDGYLEFEAPYGSIAIRIVGHSMHPAIRDGWYVVLEPDKRPAINEYVLVKFKCGRKMVKELLQIKSDSYLLLSINGDERITAMFDELDGDIQAITAVVPPSKHKEF